MSEARRPVKTFFEAEVGDEAFTWENDWGDWGDYRFETVDPFERMLAVTP